MEEANMPKQQYCASEFVSPTSFTFFPGASLPLGDEMKGKGEKKKQQQSMNVDTES